MSNNHHDGKLQRGGQTPSKVHLSMKSHQVRPYQEIQSWTGRGIPGRGEVRAPQVRRCGASQRELRIESPGPQTAFQFVGEK